MTTGFEWGGDAVNEPKGLANEPQKVKEKDSKASSSPKRGFAALLYGDTGTGKTFTAMTFPEPIIMIDTENRAINTKLGLFKNKDITIYEPVALKESVSRTMDDIFDEVKSIDNLTEALSSYVHKVEIGEIKGGTIVIDSTSDVWSFIQSWMFSKLSNSYTKKGEARANDDMMNVIDQRDWKIANNKHNGIVRILHSLCKKGIYVVYTAQEKSAPEYVTQKPTNKEKIKCQKELPFACDVIFNLKKEGNEYYAVCEKLGVQKIDSTRIKELTFEKILKLNPLGE